MFKQLLGVALLASISVGAQPVITGPNTNPSIGTSIEYYGTTIVSEGNAGASVIWDFSTIPNNGTSSADYVACSAAPDCGIMTGTNLVSSQPASYGYFIANNSRFAIRGLEANGVVFDYINAEDWTRFPFTYTDTYVDTFEVNFTSGVSWNRKGTVTVTADAYGTLILPTGTFYNTLRLHRLEEYADYYMGTPAFTYVGDQYIWYKPNNHDILLSTINLSANGSPLATTSFYTNQTPPAGVSQAGSLEHSLKLYPVPTTDVLHISFKAVQQEQVHISLLDLTGKTTGPAMDKTYTQGDHEETINTASLARGIYMLKIRNGEGTLLRKIELL